MPLPGMTGGWTHAGWCGQSLGRGTMARCVDACVVWWSCMGGRGAAKSMGGGAMAGCGRVWWLVWHGGGWGGMEGVGGHGGGVGALGLGTETCSSIRTHNCVHGMT